MRTQEPIHSDIRHYRTGVTETGEHFVHSTRGVRSFRYPYKTFDRQELVIH